MKKVIALSQIFIHGLQVVNKFMNEEIENKITEKLTERLKKEKLPESELLQIIEDEIKSRDYLKEDWQIDYAIKRIKEKLNVTSQKKISVEETGSKKYFSGRNLIINSLIAFIPATLAVTILREIGFGGALIIGSVLVGSIYLVGLIREKCENKITEKKI